jgi:hypothetical protein
VALSLCVEGKIGTVVVVFYRGVCVSVVEKKYNVYRPGAVFTVLVEKKKEKTYTHTHDHNIIIYWWFSNLFSTYCMAVYAYD